MTWILHPPSRKATKNALAAVTLTVAALAGSHIYAQSLKFESTEDAALEARISQLAPRVPGTVLQVLVDDNQSVKQGQLLVQIDPADYQTRVRQADAALRAAIQRHKAAQEKLDVTRQTSQAQLQGARANLHASQTQIDRALAGVQSAQGLRDAAASRVEVARAQVTTARRSQEQLQSQLIAAQAEVKKTRLDLTRARTLVQQEAIPAQDLDHAQAAYDTAVANAQSASGRILAAQSQIAEALANVSASQQQLAQAQGEVAQAQAQVQQAQAQVQNQNSQVDSARSAPAQVRGTRYEVESSAAEVEAARANLLQARLNLSYTQLRAPMNGRISKRQVQIGDYVQTGQTLFGEVSQERWVVANFKETQLAHMQIGQPVQIRVDAYPKVKFPGHVDSLQPGSGSRFALLPPENASGNWVKVVQRVPVKLVFDQQPDPKFNLEAGMSVEARVQVQ